MQDRSNDKTGVAIRPSVVSSASTAPWRQSVSLGMLTVAAVVGPMLATIGLFVGSTKREAPDVFALITGALLLPALKLGHRRSVRRRAMAAILIILAVAIYLTARAGLGAGLSAVMLTSCVLGVIIGGRGPGFAMMGATAVAQVIIGLLVVKRILLLDPREVDPLLLRNWFRMAASTFLLAVLLASVVDFAIRHIEASAHATTRTLEQLRLAHEAVRENEERYRSLVDHALDGVLLTSPTGETLEANPAICKILQRTSEEVCAIGKDGVVDPTDPRIGRLLEERRLTGRTRGEITMVRKDGSKVPVEMASALFVDRHGALRSSMSIRDLTERKRTERDQRLLAELGAVLSPIRYEESLNDVAPLLVRDLADFGIFYLVQPDGELTRVAAAARDPEQAWIAEALIKMRRAVRPDHPAFEVLTSQKPLFQDARPERIDPSTSTPEHLRALQAAGLKHILFVPLLLGETCLGVLALCSSSEPQREEDVPLALEIGRRCALFIESARLHRSAKRALDDLQEADRRKDEFLAMLSHELRNPLTPILTAAELLARREAGDEELGAKYRGVIVRQVRHMKRLLDDLMDVSRVSRGKIELQRERVDLNALLLQAADVSRQLIVEKRHELSLALAPHAIAVDADPVRLVQVFDNLINNAAKYTEPGGHVAVASVVENGEAVVTVRDDGVGMTPELLGRAFDLFAQGNRSLDRTQGGLGVGLTLVRLLVELHGGSVRASSEGPGRGSELVVRLPLAAPAESSRLMPTPSASDGMTAPLRVLVVDDNVDVAQGLGQLLQRLGHEVALAHDGPSALAAVGAAPPDLVLLDIGLPGMDGYAVGAALRAGGHTRMTLVAISGYGRTEDLRRSRATGFDRHLVKPIDFAQLEQVTREVAASRPR
jgi:PAS domain S-box-containing protein